ncbi:MAG: sodium:proton antiporter [Phycisphaerae bacterium]|nr:sodium:proton antiporter [Phycisphaerae bacterium]
MTGPTSTHEDELPTPHAHHGAHAHVYPLHRAFVAWGWIGCVAVGLVALAAYLPGIKGGDDAHAPATAPNGWILGCIPFAALLLSIAILPLIPKVADWWHQNLNKLAISLFAAAATLLYLVVAESPGAAAISANHAVMDEFIPFIILLSSLYVICGNINISGDLVAKPRTTTAILAIGAGIASFVGTTGASMLLIRPLLSTISERKYRVHTVVFFIFLVSNIGGTLLPIGDPPLFMGYLKGVPFDWTLTLWKEWAFCVGVLLALYFVIDTILWKREPRAQVVFDRLRVVRVSMSGKRNLVFLALVVLTVAFVDKGKELPIVGVKPFPYVREALLLLYTFLSYVLTPAKVREDNHFSFGAIIEVAVIFVGIFVAMQVPLEVLNANGDKLGITTPGQFFWATGILSSFLDNAPTYVVFLQAAEILTDDTHVHLVTLVDGNQISDALLTAVSLGAVFMGANTYIGNGPNFMVRTIAEQSGVRMPSFFGYMLWSGAILIPLFVLVHVLFLL